MMTSRRRAVEQDVQPPRAEPFDRVVVPVEGSSEELLAQQTAIEMAGAVGAELLVVHVSTGAHDPPEDIFSYAETLAADAGVPASRHVIHASDVIEELVSELGPRDLVVIGTRTLGKEDRMSSVAEELIARAPCPVQILRIR